MIVLDLILAAGIAAVAMGLLIAIVGATTVACVMLGAGVGWVIEWLYWKVRGR